MGVGKFLHCGAGVSLRRDAGAALFGKKLGKNFCKA